MFETGGKLTEELLREGDKLFLNRALKLNCIILSTVLGVFAAVGLALGRWGWAVYAAALIAFLAVMWFIHKKRTFNIIAKRMTELYGAAELDCGTVFLNEGLEFHNRVTDGRIVLRYEDMTKFAETENMYFIVTAARMVAPLFKTDLSAVEQKELMTYLKGKPTKIKWN